MSVITQLHKIPNDNLLNFLSFRRNALAFTASEIDSDYDCRWHLMSEYDIAARNLYTRDYLRKMFLQEFVSGDNGGVNRDKLKSTYLRCSPDTKLRNKSAQIQSFKEIEDLLTMEDRVTTMQTMPPTINIGKDIYPEQMPSKSFIPLDIGKSYLSEAIAFYKDIFKCLPCGYFAKDFIETKFNLNLEKSMENIESKFEILNKFTYRHPDKKDPKKIILGDVNYVTAGGTLIYLSKFFAALIVLYKEDSQLDDVLSCIDGRRKIDKKVPKFYLLNHGGGEFFSTEFNLKKFSVNLEENYNDDLPNDKIVNFINSENEAGICILHGRPGTGKTFYIRHLIKSCKKDFIYMNKECLQYINDSSFISFLTEHKESVFIMEDCENVLVDRTEYNNTISTLLNLSDGLLGDSLNNKFICTFNTDINKIDTALLRKGRMKICYEFKELDKDKANRLSEKMGSDRRFDKDVPLCEVLNSESNGNENIGAKKLRKIGF